LSALGETPHGPAAIAGGLSFAKQRPKSEWSWSMCWTSEILSVSGGGGGATHPLTVNGSASGGTSGGITRLLTLTLDVDA